MSTNATAPGPVPVDEVTKKDKSRPTKTLPTERLTVAKQLDILRAYAAASANGTKAATINEVAEIVKMAPSTVSMANAFLSDVGFLQRSAAGSYMPSAEVISFLRAYEWNPETASHKLGPLLKNSWFGETLIPRITFGPTEEDTAVGILADAAAAGPDYKRELKALLDFLVYGGVIVREGTQIKLAKPAAIPEPSQPRQEEMPVGEAEPAQKPGKNVMTALRSTAGGVSFNVDVQVDMAEFATWRPERIQAFFRGIAEVLAAKADVEKGGGSV